MRRLRWVPREHGPACLGSAVGSRLAQRIQCRLVHAGPVIFDAEGEARRVHFDANAGGSCLKRVEHAVLDRGGEGQHPDPILQLR